MSQEVTLTELSKMYGYSLPAVQKWRDRVKDLEPLLRRAPQWSDAQVRQLLAAYLDQPEDSALVATWYQRLSARRSHKENR